MRSRPSALDDRLAEAHCSLALVVWEGDRDVEKAERLLRHAVALDRNCALGHARLVRLLEVTECVDAGAIRASQHAPILDPLSPLLALLLANGPSRAARFHEAIEQAGKAIELEPELVEAWEMLWINLASAWDWDRAERVLREIVARFPNNPSV